MTDTLTGVWDGTYTQPGVGIVTFLATLIESGGALGGSVSEPCMMHGCPLSTHNASIAGNRSGSAVLFVKRYEPPGYGYDAVAYVAQRAKAEACPPSRVEYQAWARR